MPKRDNLSTLTHIEEALQRIEHIPQIHAPLQKLLSEVADASRDG